MLRSVIDANPSTHIKTPHNTPGRANPHGLSVGTMDMISDLPILRSSSSFKMASMRSFTPKEASIEEK